MKIRRTFLWELRDCNMLKAVALLMFYKNKYKSSTIKDFTYNKVHKETGLHITTIKKRISTLKRQNLVFVQNGHIVFRSIASGNHKRNVDVICEEMCVKDIEKSLYASMFIEIQRRKDFAQHTIQVAFNPSTYESLKNIKNARRLCKRYGWGRKYTERGFSYNTIAKKLNVCLQKAFEIVKFAISKGFVEKVKHIVQIHVQGIGYAKKYLTEEGKGIFVTKHNVYKAYANTYTIAR